MTPFTRELVDSNEYLLLFQSVICILYACRMWMNMDLYSMISGTCQFNLTVAKTIKSYLILRHTSCAPTNVPKIQIQQMLRTGQFLVDCAVIVRQHIPLFDLPVIPNMFYKSGNKCPFNINYPHVPLYDCFYDCA